MSFCFVISPLLDITAGYWNITSWLGTSNWSDWFLAYMNELIFGFSSLTFYTLSMFFTSPLNDKIFWYSSKA